MPPPLSFSSGRPSASRAAEQTQHIAVLSHAEYVPTLTAAAALRVKAALSQAAWWPFHHVTSFDLESGVQVTCDVGYLCTNFGPPSS